MPEAEFSEDVPLEAPLDKVCLAAILTMCDHAGAVIPKEYFKEKIERALRSETWWQVRAILHPSLRRQFYDHIDHVCKDPNMTAAVRDWHALHGWGR